MVERDRCVCMCVCVNMHTCSYICMGFLHMHLMDICEFLCACLYHVCSVLTVRELQPSFLSFPHPQPDFLYGQLTSYNLFALFYLSSCICTQQKNRSEF